MSHELFGDRFFGRQEAPAWHALGTVEVVDLSAVKAYKRLGMYDVELAKMQGVLANGQRIEIDDRAIVRHPTSDDPSFVHFGTVGPEYELITPAEACALYDEHVGKPVETMAAIREGRIFFFSTKLPAIDVKGDDVEMYLLTSIPMDGMHVASIFETGVRAVCSNTLTLAEELASVTLRIVHDKTAKERLAAWMQESFEGADERTALIKEAFEVLASTRVTAPQLKHVIEIAYPFPKLPRNDAPQSVMKKRHELHEQKVDRVTAYRVAAQACCEGAGTGLDTKAAKGTAWGVYNGVSEYEQWGRRGSTRGNGEDYNVADELLFGMRRETVQRTFAACLALAKK